MAANCLLSYADLEKEQFALLPMSASYLLDQNIAGHFHANGNSTFLHHIFITWHFRYCYSLSEYSQADTQFAAIFTKIDATLSSSTL